MKKNDIILIGAVLLIAIIAALVVSLLGGAGAYVVVRVDGEGVGILAAVLWLGTMEIAYYLPVLLISGTVAGVLIGIVSGMLVKRLEKIKF